MKKPEISAAMHRLGYNNEKMAEGLALLESTAQCFDTYDLHEKNKQDALHKFENTSDLMMSIYQIHCKKIKAIALQNSTVVTPLEFATILPNNYAKWIRKIKTFYFVISTDPLIKNHLWLYNTGEADLEEVERIIFRVENAQENYCYALKEEQKLADKKNKAFLKLNQWMHQFSTTAQRGLAEQPALLELFFESFQQKK
ncbi:hypothetical protein PEPS_26510 [Persicobacter psychrovividus]|uniref:Uncharacterized protein n=2 Tax=Persicobacter psychrovividus TaxID=387638 RepID=A0ABM7VHD4_9BACT|nr:hypothetical protein PEPS_26510 [Persicobacter psychrovividus]